MTGLDFSYRTDFENADRGFIARLEPGVVRNRDGRVVSDNDAFAFLGRECPETVNASLWRQSRLTAKHALFEVANGIYQVRALDLSNMTMVEGDRGVIVVDALISGETAAGAYELYQQHRGRREVTAVIYTHSHIDHYGGVLGVVDRAATVPIVAPEGAFPGACSVGERLPGTAMARRAAYMYGSALERSAAGTVGVGLGAAWPDCSARAGCLVLDVGHVREQRQLAQVQRQHRQIQVDLVVLLET